jgi:hypothetical protein
VEEHPAEEQAPGDAGRRVPGLSFRQPGERAVSPGGTHYTAVDGLELKGGRGYGSISDDKKRFLLPGVRNTGFNVPRSTKIPNEDTRAGAEALFNPETGVKSFPKAAEAFDISKGTFHGIKARNFRDLISPKLSAAAKEAAAKWGPEKWKDATRKRLDAIGPEELSRIAKARAAVQSPEERSRIAKERAAKQSPGERSRIAKEWQANKGPEERSRIAKARAAKQSPEERSRIAKERAAKQGPEERSRIAKERAAKQGPEERSRIAKERAANKDPEERSRIAKKAAATLGEAGQKAARRKQIETMGPDGRSEAAKKAAVTRLANRFFGKDKDDGLTTEAPENPGSFFPQRPQPPARPQSPVIDLTHNTPSPMETTDSDRDNSQEPGNEDAS